MRPTNEVYLLRVMTDDREYKLWAAAMPGDEEAVQAVLDMVPEGWAVSLLKRAKPDEIEALALKRGEVRELPNVSSRQGWIRHGLTIFYRSPGHTAGSSR
jgi:hypothetical protein